MFASTPCSLSSPLHNPNVLERYPFLGLLFTFFLFLTPPQTGFHLFLWLVLNNLPIFLPFWEISPSLLHYLAIKWQCFSRQISNSFFLFAQYSMPQRPCGFNSHVYGESSEFSLHSGLSSETNPLCPTDHLTFPFADSRAPHTLHVQIKLMTMSSLNLSFSISLYSHRPLTHLVMLLRNLEVILEISISFDLHLHLITQLCNFST